MEGLNHMLLILQLGVDELTIWPMWTRAAVPWGFLRAPRIPVWTVDRGEHASHKCPVERAVSNVP